MRKILCTTGTSIAGGPIRQAKQTGAAESVKQYAGLIQERIAKCRQEAGSEEDFLAKLSAETNSLRKLKVCPDDKVVLLHTETDDGQICAEALQRVLQEQLAVESRLVQIEGLQVHDAARFRRLGIQNLFQTLQKELEEWPENQVILNATGGFKSVVPYLTLFGLLHRLPVVYIFEWSPVLLSLPPASINFDYERLAQAEKALSTLQQEGVMPKERFFELIPGLKYEERSWYESLLEDDAAGDVTLSAFGTLLASALRRERSEVYLSREAWQSYSSSHGTERMAWDMLLSKIGDQLWRQGHRHSFRRSDLEVYKPGQTPHRLAGFLRGNQMYVCLLYANHQEYERDLPNHRKADWINRLNEFVPWYPPSDEKPAATEDELFDRCRQEWEHCQHKLQLTEHELEQAHQELEITAQQLEHTKQELESFRQVAQRTQRELESARQELAHTKQDLETTNEVLQQTQQELESTTQQLEGIKQQRQEIEAAYRLATERVSQLTEANRLLEESRTVALTELDELKRKTEHLAAELQEREKRLSALQQMLAEANRALAWANRPWWRKLLGRPPAAESEPQT